MLDEVGLGYLRLGQSGTTLSGGEAQRLKLAAHLTRQDNNGILYIFDEPTTGLHFDDIQKLLTAFRKLIEGGASVLIIEHNLDVIKSADWMIDLGPEGGDAGGTRGGGGNSRAGGAQFAIAHRKISGARTERAQWQQPRQSRGGDKAAAPAPESSDGMKRPSMPMQARWRAWRMHWRVERLLGRQLLAFAIPVSAQTVGTSKKNPAGSRRDRN